MRRSEMKSGTGIWKVLLLTLAIAILLQGCRLTDVLDRLTGLTEWTWPSVGYSGTEDTSRDGSASSQSNQSGQTSQTGQSGWTDGTGTSPNTVPSDSSDPGASTGTQAPVIDFTAPDPAFDALLGQLIEEGLEARAEEILLDKAFDAFWVRETDIDACLAQIQSAFARVYQATARYFYLNGSFQANYTILRSGNNRITTMRLTPERWGSTQGLTPAQIDQLVRDVEAVARGVAREAGSQAVGAAAQLTYVHDWLVRHLAYDQRADQATNHAGHALLNGVTLCQGYAQSFQMIGQMLGYDVRIISGASEGIGHAWNLVMLDGLAYHVDVTHDDPTPDGGPARPVRHVHLFRSDAMMRQTHQWQAADYPAASRDGAFYHRSNGLIAADRDALAYILDGFFSTLDLKKGGVWQGEWLYTGQDLPDQEDLVRIVTDALEGYARGTAVYYRTDQTKSVIVVQISTEA